MAGRPKDPTVNKKIYQEINRLLETTHFKDMTIDQIAENTSVSKATIYRRWRDKESMIVDMFVDQSRIIEPEFDTVFDNLYDFLIKIMNIYKTPLGSAVIEILISNQQTEAKDKFMKEYFERNRSILKSIISKDIDEADQDLFIDIIFSPIYFNILIKPQTLTKEYIENMLSVALKAYDI
ncbi:MULTISPECIES: TetR/AcrR family transcriptional regulator [Staphylococcus]|uniref:Transcriptional regulator, TetR family n=2 Tax=Staphylococcus TaxID=1279 RepID=A0ABY1H3J0_9STAP|nr:MULTISPECIES: TetR/AcrR family transcriptional regulator [Staphylococcus]KKI55755.1 transcriptional regulator AcrR family [Staphylococcus pasteuri]MBM6506225.1 TetR/AcrR family transcriptional regulator [Staphylococcus pasteuri]MCF7599626.1 TetR/AcrR family transcriptional regulator [Staphylococcus pasteuri]MDI3232079.1 TetR/AcrR family transcriptional regulator [Staphylococcus pasteuri]MDO6573649.1 TetR/AcrR family transcriptional regulator [Staphylococcus pasteuri_A]